MTKGSTSPAAGSGALYCLGIFGALFYYWQQANSFWEYVWAMFPKAIFGPAYMVYEGCGRSERDVFRRSRRTGPAVGSGSVRRALVECPEQAGQDHD